MKKEYKDLLRELCARLPYGVNLTFHSKKGIIPATLVAIDFDKEILHIKPVGQNLIYCYFIEDDNFIYKPFLRPVSSMTQVEIDAYFTELDKDERLLMEGLSENYKDKLKGSDGSHSSAKYIPHFGYDWLIAHNFDVNHLIERELAVEAPKEMYEEV